ncbi:uncharacterized bromodomain-containing protein 10 isoform X2 [Struthio camelus]
MWLLKMEEKFSSGQYTGITDFVADFRLMLEMCYRLHGVDHWLSKQAQKLEMMLEQKLALLSRHLRAKTTIAVTSRGCYGLEDEKGAACASTRRRSAPRALVGLTTGVFESIMVQVLRQEEQLRAKEEKRLREQERKEAEEASQKEMEEWEKSLLAQAAPTRMETMWEIPAIGHFLCLAQQILNLPEIVFYELERCLLMPQCNAFLSKIMTSLLSPPHCRSTLHRKPTLPYGTWEAALRQKVQQWYTVVGQTDDPSGCAEKLGLCPQFFEVLGEVNPLEEKPFHELPFHQKVWLLKGLCDFVYETQKDVQDAVLGQPIHECREVILGYDYFENAYVHFPQFCGADVRIYKQKPFQAPEFPTPAIKVKKVPRIKLEKAKCEHVNKSNEEVASDGREELLPCANTEPGKSFNYIVCCPGKKIHLDSFSVTTEEIKLNCEIKTERVCDIKKGACCKENLEKTINPGEIIGFGELLGTGEIRVVENWENYDKASIVKTEPSLLKGNTLKTCQMHVNHNGNPEMICHKITKETTLENSLRNNKKLKLTNMLAKKKKKKKKKLKDTLNENLQRKLDDSQRKREIHSHTFKSYKSEIQNKLFIIKKTAKHKHKSGKKSISKKAIRKKRKAVAKSAVPEFQLICTNLDELRELIKKIENELMDLEDMKKKSGRWYYRKQAVKELHSTLIRLLNELLPWELKLMKAFQRNRSRLKKDYDDFQRQPDHDKFTRELWSNDKSEGDADKDSFEVITSKSSESAEHEDASKKDHHEMKLLEVVLPAGKSRLLKKEWTSKEIHKTLTKSVKRQSKQNSCLDDSTNELSPRKKAKLSTTEAVVQSSERGMQTDSCLTELKQYEQPAPESFSLSDPATSVSNFLKGTKPIQALLAKSIGNKVTLTNQLLPPLGINVSTSEKTVISPMESLPIKPTLPCQTSSRSPLQTAYKMPSSHYIPIDLHNRSVKIQMQPVIDPKTGEKVMQPKNFLIQQNKGKIISKDVQSLKQKSSELHCTTFSQAAIVNVSLTPVLVTPTAHATNQLPSTIFNKNIMHLSQLTSPVNRLHPLHSITSTSNSLSSTITMSHSETDQTKSTVSAATFPISLALPTVSTASQPFTSVTTLSGSTNTTSSFNSLTSQKNSDSSEAKQELKTVCIRESQSIMVTTRGGNTGIVKVQTNPDQISPNSLSPSSFFAYAPQLQTFLVPKSTALSTSTLSSIATATSGFPLFGQSSVSGFATSTVASVNIPAFPAGLNQIKGKNFKCTLGQPPRGGILDQIEKTCHVSSPTFLPPLSSTSTLMSEIPSSPVNAISVGQNNTGITPNSSIEQQGNTKKRPLIQSETSTAKNGDVISGTPIQKVMLVTNPPILSPCGATGVNIIPSPASTGVSAQKLVFINPPLPSDASSLVTESSKQTLPSSLKKTFVGATEQPQLVLIPSTVEVPIKKKSSSNVAQVKDVKIGLNIGQAFVNTKGNEQQAPPINILQSVISKGENKNKMGFTLCLSSSGSLVPVRSSFASQSVTSLNESIGIVTKAATAFTVTAANAHLESVSVTSSETSVGTQPTVLIGGNNTSRIRPVLAKQLCTSNIGNTVDISTGETGHLASSVLVSTTQPTVSPQNLSSILQFPAVSLPGSVATSPKVIHTVPHFTAVPALPSLPKDQPPTLLQFQSPGISAAVTTNADNHKSQTVLSSASQNTGKVISFPNFSSLQCQQMPPNIVKQSHTYTCTSAIQVATASPTVKSQEGDQLNELCMQQKIIINTCMPLAPGTEIMINGTHFIVPSQGLGPGSHVLLLSSNTKQTPLPLAINHGQGAQGVPIVNPIPLKITLAPTNSLSWQTSKHPLKSSTKIVNSSGSANALPTVHAVPHILNTPASACAPPSTTTLSTSSVIKPPANVLVATSLISAMHPGNCQLSRNTSVFDLDTSIKKLLVSPEGAILNAINTSASKVSTLPPVIVSTSRNPITIFPPFRSSCLDKPDKAAS